MSRRIRGITIEIGGETTKLEKSLQSVYDKSKGLTREMREVNRALKFNPKNVELTAQKQSILKEQVENTRNRLNELKGAQEQVNEQYRKGEIGEEQYRAFQREIVETESILKTYENQLSEVADKHKIIGKSMEEIGGKMQDVGGKMVDVGKNLTMKVTTPIVGIATAASKLGIDFEKSMSEVAAVSGATGEELEQLEAAAREAGATTDKSARDAADALQYMALAGWSVEDSQQALMPVLKLSSAANMDLGRTSDLVTDTMSVLGLEIDDLESYLDVLAQTSRNSNTDVDQLGESFLVVGGKLTQLNVDVEEGAVALGLLADNGIKGSEAGRGLNAILTNLTAPTGRAKDALEELGISAFDSNGEFIGIEETLQLVKDATSGMTQEQQNLYLSMIAGKEHGKTLNALMSELGGGFESLANDVSGADGALEEMYDTATDNTMGALNNLRSAVEELGLKLFENLQPAVEKITGVVQGFVDKLNELTPKQQETVVQVGLMVAALGPALIVFGKFTQTVGTLVKAGGMVVSNWGKIAGAGKVLAGGLKATVGLIFSPAGAIMLGIAAVVAGGVWLYKNWDTVKEKGAQLKDSLSESWTNLKEKTSEAWTGMKESVSEKMQEMKLNTAENLFDISESFGQNLSESNNVVSQKMGEIVLNFTDRFGEAYGETESILGSIGQAFSGTFGDIKLDVATSVYDITESIGTNLSESNNVVSQKLGDIVSNFSSRFGEAYGETESVLGSIKTAFTGTFTDVKIDVAAKMYDVSESIGNRLMESESKTANTLGLLVNNFTSSFGQAYGETESIFGSIKIAMTNTISMAKDSVVSKITEMKNNMVSRVAETKNNTVAKFNELKTGATTAISNTVSAVGNKFSEVYGKITSPINRAKEGVRTAINQMKGFFNFNWELPKIKMPKFSVSGSANPLNWLKEGPPKLNVSWHAKGGILTRPGIFGMMGNTLLAGGEHRTGGEAILPLNRLPQIMADAMERVNRQTSQPQPQVVRVSDNSLDIDEITSRLDILIKKSMDVYLGKEKVGEIMDNEQGRRTDLQGRVAY